MQLKWYLGRHRRPSRMAAAAVAGTGVASAAVIAATAPAAGASETARAAPPAQANPVVAAAPAELVKAVVAAEPDKRAHQSRTVTVVPGDTLSGIAAQHGTTWQHLWHVNKQIKDPNLIYPGQHLKLHGTTHVVTVHHGRVGHTGCDPSWTDVRVKAGDTMGKIAETCGVRLSQVLAANPHKVPTDIRVGQRVWLHVTSSTPSTHASHASTDSSSSFPGSASTSSSGYLPANYQTIASFLMAHGYSKTAAAGILGNIWQESQGNPESAGMGGGGLIGWTPLPAGFVTGNPSADLATQLQALLAYNSANGSVGDINAAAVSPAAAAAHYSNNYERPGIPAMGNRIAAANAVYSAL